MGTKSLEFFLRITPVNRASAPPRCPQKNPDPPNGGLLGGLYGGLL